MGEWIMALVDDIQQAYQPFLTGDLGYSPATQAGVGAFMQNTLPVIQNQLQLQGLGNGPQVADVAGRSLATALPQFIQNDQQNRLAAAQGATGFGANLLLPGIEQSTSGLQSAGELQRGLSQDVFDAQREEQLRLQGLSESATTGAFGTYQPITKTESSGSK